MKLYEPEVADTVAGVCEIVEPGEREELVAGLQIELEALEKGQE